MMYATERQIINHCVAYGSLKNAGQSTISSQTRKQDAVFRPSNNSIPNGTKDSINEGLAQNSQYIDVARQGAFLGIFSC
jgi:hypothetical protein